MSGAARGAAGAWWAVSLVAISLVLGLVLSADPERLEGIHSAGPDTYSYSVLGHRALAAFLERSGFEVARLRTESIGDLDEDAAMVVAEPPALRDEEPDSTDSNPLVEAAQSGAPFVLALPKWNGDEDPGRPGWVGTKELLPLPVVAYAARPYRLGRTTLVRGGADSLRCATAWGESVTVCSPRLQWIKASRSVTPVVWRDSVVMVARFEEVIRPWDLDEGDEERDTTYAYVVSDPDLINNQGLARADHARLVRRLFADELHVHRVVFDERVHHGVISRSLAAELLRYPLVLVLAQSVVLLVFVTWALGGRFGAPQPLPPPAASRAALVQTAVELLTAAGSPAITLMIYWEQVLRDVAARYARPAGSERTAVFAMLTEVGRARGAHSDVRELQRQVDLLQRGEGREERAVVQVAGLIHEWYREMTHGR